MKQLIWFPKFKEGMSTWEYIQYFDILNHLKPCPESYENVERLKQPAPGGKHD